MSSYRATNYKYIVYILIRSAVSKYRTDAVLKEANIELPREQKRALKRLMRNFLYKLAEESYAEFYKSFDGSDMEYLLQKLEINAYLGDIEFRGAEIMQNAIYRRERQLEGLYQINQQYSAEITQLEREIARLQSKTG